MVKEATLQVRMQPDVKADVERLYRSLGTSFAEAVRIFACQSLVVGGLPFAVALKPEAKQSMFGAANRYADPLKRAHEDGGAAWKCAVMKKRAADHA